MERALIGAVIFTVNPEIVLISTQPRALQPSRDAPTTYFISALGHHHKVPSLAPSTALAA